MFRNYTVIIILTIMFCEALLAVVLLITAISFLSETIFIFVLLKPLGGGGGLFPSILFITVT